MWSRRRRPLVQRRSRSRPDPPPPSRCRGFWRRCEAWTDHRCRCSRWRRASGPRAWPPSPRRGRGSPPPNRWAGCRARAPWPHAPDCRASRATRREPSGATSSPDRRASPGSRCARKCRAPVDRPHGSPGRFHRWKAVLRRPPRGCGRRGRVRIYRRRRAGHAEYEAYESREGWPTEKKRQRCNRSRSTLAAKPITGPARLSGGSPGPAEKFSPDSC